MRRMTTSHAMVTEVECEDDVGTVRLLLKAIYSKDSSAPASCKNIAARRNSLVRLRVVPGDGDESAKPALAGDGNLAFLTLARQRRRADRLPQGDRTDPAAALLALPRRRQAQRRAAARVARRRADAGRFRACGHCARP